MLITIVTETYEPDINGVAMTLGNLVSGLSELGHSIQLVCPSNEERKIAFPHNITYLPVKGVAIPKYNEAKFGLPSKTLLKNLWEKSKPDIIYVATEGPLGWQAVKTANKFNIPVTSGFHTNFHSYSSHYGIGIFEKIVSSYLVKLHNKTLATLTPTLGQKSIIENMGINNVSIVGRGVNTSLFSPKKRSAKLRNSWGIKDAADPVLLYVGRIAAEKNLDLAINTYHEMFKINNKIKFVLVGDGPLLNTIKKNNPDLIFAGMKSGDELAQYYASSDIFLFPSMTETFGNVVLEAMASGLGVVAYDYAAASTHIYPGKNGQLAYLGNSDEFIHKACQYLNNFLLLQRTQMNAASYASTQSWADIVQKFETILLTHSTTNFTDQAVGGM